MPSPLGSLELLAEDVVHVRISHAEEAQRRCERFAGLLRRQPVAEETAERGDAGARAHQDHVALRVRAGPERLPGRVDPGADQRPGRHPRQMVGRDPLEQSDAGARRRVEHADDHRHLVRRQPRRRRDRIVPWRHGFQQFEEFGARQRARRELIQALQRAQRARVGRLGQLLEPFGAPVRTGWPRRADAAGCGSRACAVRRSG